MVARLTLVYISLIVISLILTGQSSAKIDPKTCVGMWLFDEDKGDTAKDSSGNGNDGKITGAKWVDGKFGKALSFNGTSDFVEIPHADILTVDKEVTVTAWIITDRYEVPGAGYQGIVAKSNDTRSYSLYTTASGVVHFSTAGVGTTSIAKVPLNEWVHITAVVVDGKHRYYFNGNLDSETGAGIKLPGLSDTATVLIGKTHEGSREFKGIIDEVAIFNVALTADDIKTIVDSGLSRALGITAVSPLGKLTITWAVIKAR
jgi:hypothetical protein